MFCSFVADSVRLSIEKVIVIPSLSTKRNGIIRCVLCMIHEFPETTYVLGDLPLYIKYLT